jgi:hypothetical protein
MYVSFPAYMQEITQRQLDQYTIKLADSLLDYGEELKSVEFGKFDDFSFTPEKPNTARTVVPVLYQGDEVGKIYAIVFAPQDGTGDTNTYTLSQIQLPAQIQHPERLLPRKKSCIMEAFFPFFTEYNGAIFPNTACLDEIVVDKNGGTERAMLLWNLGVSPERFHRSVNDALGNIPHVQLTTGHYRNGERFGDPHAVYCDPISSFKAIQVVGFLAVDNKDNPLCPLLDKIAEVPELKRNY